MLSFFTPGKNALDGLLKRKTDFKKLPIGLRAFFIYGSPECQNAEELKDKWNQLSIADKTDLFVTTMDDLLLSDFSSHLFPDVIAEPIAPDTQRFQERCVFFNGAFYGTNANTYILEKEFMKSFQCTAMRARVCIANRDFPYLIRLMPEGARDYFSCYLSKQPSHEISIFDFWSTASSQERFDVYQDLLWYSLTKAQSASLSPVVAAVANAINEEMNMPPPPTTTPQSPTVAVSLTVSLTTSTILGTSRSEFFSQPSVNTLYRASSTAVLTPKK